MASTITSLVAARALRALRTSATAAAGRAALSPTATASRAVLFHTARRQQQWQWQHRAQWGYLAAAAGAASLAATAMCDDNSDDKHKDELSGITFVRQCPPAAGAPESPDQVLVATGTRTVTFLGIYVYAVGLYVNRLDFFTSFSGTGVYDATKEEFRNIFFKSGAIRRTLRISPYRNAEYSHLRDGLARAAEIRAEGLPEDEAKQVYGEIAELKRLFPKGTLRVGEEMVISVDGDTIHLELNGQSMGAVKSKFLTRSMFVSYFDDQAVSADTKAKFVEGLNQLLDPTNPVPTRPVA